MSKDRIVNEPCPDCGDTDRIAEGTECSNCGHVFPDRCCGACGSITEGDLYHDCDLAPAGMATIRDHLAGVPYVIVDALGFFWGATTSRDIALECAGRMRGRAITTIFGEIVEVDP